MPKNPVKPLKKGTPFCKNKILKKWGRPSIMIIVKIETMGNFFLNLNGYAIELNGYFAEFWRLML